MIFTFYSYKGGVGRSMALANIAEFFYNAGFKVLMVDWDLEAPGLERFFEIDYANATDKPGIIDMLQGYKKVMSKELPAIDNVDSFPFEKPDQFIIDIYPNIQKEGHLWLLSAGKRSEAHFSEYASTVLNFDWFEFYQEWDGELYFEWLRKQFLKMADIILIDSRTGVTEMGGVCTYQLADVVVMFCAPNQQNIYGISEMAENFKMSVIKNLRHGRPLDLIIVPARVEDRAETKLLNSFHDIFVDKFSKYLPEKLGSGPEEFWKLKIPHVPYYAFNEEVAIRDKGITRSEDLVKAYASLAKTISRFIYSYLADAQPNYTNSPVELSKHLRSQGVFAKDAGDLTEAEELLTQSLELANSAKDTTSIIKTNIEFAKLAKITGKMEQANKIFDDILVIINHTNDKNEIINLYLLLGNLAADLGRLEEAERYYDKCIAIELQSNNKVAASKQYFELAKQAIEKNDHSKVLLYFNLIISIYKNKKMRKDEALLAKAQKDLIDLEKVAISSGNPKMVQLWLYLFMEFINMQHKGKNPEYFWKKGFDELQKSLGPSELMKILNIYLKPNVNDIEKDNK
jgi:tetratricopeptide (TPR) repeat protein